LSETAPSEVDSLRLDYLLSSCPALQKQLRGFAGAISRIRGHVAKGGYIPPGQ